jgi:hypothetical protein
LVLCSCAAGAGFGLAAISTFSTISPIALLKPCWRGRLLRALDEGAYARILESTVKEGPAIDGFTRAPTLSVDGFCLEKHTAKIRKVREIAGT